MGVALLTETQASAEGVNGEEEMVLMSVGPGDPVGLPVVLVMDSSPPGSSQCSLLVSLYF